MDNHQHTSPGSETPWIAEPSGDGFHRVVNAQGVVLAERCVEEEAALFAAAPALLQACRWALERVPPTAPPLVRALRGAIEAAGGC